MELDSVHCMTEGKMKQADMCSTEFEYMLIKT